MCEISKKNTCNRRDTLARMRAFFKLVFIHQILNDCITQYFLPLMICYRSLFIKCLLCNLKNAIAN